MKATNQRIIVFDTETTRYEHDSALIMKATALLKLVLLKSSIVN